MKGITLAFAAAAFAGLIGAAQPGFAQTPGPAAPAPELVPPGGGALSDADRAFITAAAEAGAAKVGMSELAADQAKAGRVQDLARKVAEDQAAANEELAAIAAAKGVRPPATASVDQQHAIENLEQLAGTGFDVEYLAQQVAWHEDTIALYRTQLAQTEDDDLRRFIETQLPMLEDHLALASEMNEYLKQVAN